MTALKKPRKDAKLKNLSEDRQALVFSWLNGELGYSGALTKCKSELGVSTSLDSLRDFFVWYSLRQQSLEDEQTVDSLIERIEQQQGATLSQEKRFQIGQEMFELLAIRRQDPTAWTNLQKVNVARSADIRENRKFQRETCELFLKWFNDKQARETANNPKLSHEDKVETLGKQMFGDLWD